VQCNSLVRYNAFTNATVPACTTNPLAFGAGVDAIAMDVVQMQAQYGVSTSGSSDVVTEWVEASGATWGGSPSATNVSRIKALRIVLVTRSREAEGTQVSAPCTNAAGIANTGPCSFQDAAAPGTGRAPAADVRIAHESLQMTLRKGTTALSTR
jgi:type IV pilus assembly protein PilW